MRLFNVQINSKKNRNATIIIPSLIIALFVAIGVSLDLTGTIETLFVPGSKKATPWSMFVLVVIFSFMIIRLIYQKLDSWQISEKIRNCHLKIKHIDKIEKFYRKHPYISVYILFLIVDLPYMIATYPAMFWGDAPAQIMQGYNLKDETASYLKLLNENFYLNQHHPVPHTLLIHLCVALGKNIFGSYNFGIFIYAFLQFTFITLIVAYIAHYFYERKIPKILIIVMLGYYLLSPRIQNHMFLVTKDIIYGVFTMLFVVSLWDLLVTERDKVVIKQVILVLISGLGVFLFRNEGKVVGGTVLFLAVLFGKGKRKYVAVNLAILILIVYIINNIVYPAFNISPGSRREKMCLPFQQTALYLRDYPDEITEEEKEAIGNVLNYDYMLTCYVWNRADPAKVTFNENCTDKEFIEYLKVWWQMFLKHPVTYFQATLYQTYGYFYPSAGFLYRVPYFDSSWLMKHTNEKCADIGADFHHPESLKWYRWLYEKGWELIARTPPVILLSLSATYLWGLIVLAFYFIRRKRWAALIVSVQLFFQYAVCFAGPLDGTCFRYIYPMVMTLIPLLYAGVFLERNIE